MTNKSAWETYDGRIYDMRQEGNTLQKIGDTIGVTRERVRQILVEKHNSTEIKNNSLITSKELSLLTNLSARHIKDLANQNIIVQPVRQGLWPVDVLETLLERRQCRICNGLLPKGRKSYCPGECAQKGHKIMADRVIWRRLSRKLNQPFPPSCAYIYPNKSPYINPKRRRKEGQGNVVHYI